MKPVERKTDDVLETPLGDIPFGDIFDDGIVTTEELDSYLDWNQNGYFEIDDFKELESLANGRQVFGDIKETFRKHHFHLEDALTSIPLDNRTPSFIREDRDFVLAAVTQNGSALLYADGSLRKDREIVLAAVKQSGSILLFADEGLRKDREIVLAAVTQNGWALEFADESLRSNISFLNEAFLVNLNVMDHIAPSLRENVWQQAMRLAGEQENPFPSEMIQNWESFTKGLRDFGITSFPKRFRSLTTLHTIWENKQIPIPEGKPVALLIYNRNDLDGAFNRYPLIDQLVEEDRWHVIYAEVSDEKAVYDLLEAVSGGEKRPIHTLVLAGHGTSETLALGGEDLRGRTDLPEEQESQYIDMSDFTQGEWNNLTNQLSPDGQILLFSCSNGEGGEGTENLANAFVQKSPSGVLIHSATAPTNIESVEILPDLRLEVRWTAGVSSYEALSQQTPSAN